MACLPVSYTSAEENSADQLQTLFYTAKQRARIDHARKHTGTQKSKLDKNQHFDNSKKKQKAKKSIVIEGYLKRSDGKNVVWYNHTNTLVDKNNKNLKIKSRSIKLEGVGVISKNKLHRLKPGQQLDVNTGKVKENFQLEDGSASLTVENKE